MVAPNDDRGGKLPRRHHLVECETQAMALTQTHPADPRRQSLKFDALARHVEPAVQMRIIGNELLDFLVRAVDILGIARESAPAERSDAAAEERPDVCRHETRKRKGILHSRIEGHLANVVAVVKSGHAAALTLEHRLHVA